MIEIKIKNLIQETLKQLSLETKDIVLEHPGDLTHGDYATSIALVLSKQTKSNPRELAEKIKTEIEKSKPNFIEKIEVAGPGFINFYLSRQFFVDSIKNILGEGKKFGSNKNLKGKKVLVEYTDPNPFKEFHIGHLMSNTIGESISRLVEWGGAKTLRACYQGDVGLHVAKTVWAILQNQSQYPSGKSSLKEKVAFLGTMYALGSVKHEEGAEIKNEIEKINKKIFDSSDKEINRVYKEGRKWSLEAFELIYEKLGTKFDYNFFESEIADDGIKIVREFLKKGIFEDSEGAVVFKADKYNPKLHTRVFINSQGLPTYETKEIGLTQKKFKKINPDLSIVITANEQNDYFKVVLEALKQIEPKWQEKTKHISHGLLRFATGKMSSRAGNVITGESLITQMESMVFEKMKERDFDTKEKAKIAEEVAVGAIKYSILRQAVGGDIIYDFEKSLSFEGDSGPYLQYAHTRACSLLDKASREGVKASIKNPTVDISVLEKNLYRFPEIIDRASFEYAPHYIATYLIELASIFNAFYANEKIVDKDDENSSYKVAITESFTIVMKNGLSVLGIKTPSRM
jgi:arginyl-tRNA synthetase